MKTRRRTRCDEAVPALARGEIQHKILLYEGKLAFTSPREGSTLAGEAGGVVAQKFGCFFFMLSTPFQALTLFTSCSHPVSVLPACGFRLEIVPPAHKKKSELYFA